MKRWISAVPIALGAMLLIGCGVRAGLAAKQNGEVINGFRRVEYSSSQYEQGLPMEQIDFQKCAAANVTLGNYGKGKSYVLQTTLHFFDSPSSPVPAVTLEKGTEIYSCPPVALNARGEPEYNIPALNLLSFLNCLFEIELLLELFNTTAAVDKFLLASKERMAC